MFIWILIDLLGFTSGLSLIVLGQHMEDYAISMFDFSSFLVDYINKPVFLSKTINLFSTSIILIGLLATGSAETIRRIGIGIIIVSSGHLGWTLVKNWINWDINNYLHIKKMIATISYIIGGSLLCIGALLINKTVSIARHISGTHEIATMLDAYRISVYPSWGLFTIVSGLIGLTLGYHLS